MTDETYNGWTNRETWAVALHINNDQGWQESIHEALGEADLRNAPYDPTVQAIKAGRIIRENVEDALDPFAGEPDAAEALVSREGQAARDDIGSLWRVNWDELGASFLADLEA